MKAPKTRKLMILSSTISTLIGGTELSSKPGGKLGGSIGFGLGLRVLVGLGEDTRGTGGVEDCRVFGSVGGGGVGMEALPLTECFSEAEESCLTRWVGRVEVADCGTLPPPKMVGEAVLCRRLLGRLAWVLRVPPGEYSAGNWPVWRTDMECGARVISWVAAAAAAGEGFTMGISGKYSV